MSRKYKFLNPDGLFFVTLTVVNWLDVFVKYSYRDIIVDNLKYCQENKGLLIHSWVIMTNHIHMIISRNKEPKCEEILRDFKKFTTKEIIREIKESNENERNKLFLKVFSEFGSSNSNNVTYQFWIQDNHPIELLTKSMIDQKLDYIHNNPVESGFVFEPHQYPYSSAIDYSGGKGMIDIVFLD